MFVISGVYYSTFRAGGQQGYSEGVEKVYEQVRRRLEAAGLYSEAPTGLGIVSLVLQRQAGDL